MNRETDDDLRDLWPIWGPLWRWRKSWGGWVFPIAICAAYGIVGGGGYKIAVHMNEWRGAVVWTPESAWDHAIPALPWTLTIYVTLYLYLPLFALTRPRTDAGRIEVAQLVQAQVLVGAISCALFLILPCEVVLREEMRSTLTSSPFWQSGFELLWWIDPPWNAWPSLHVSSTWLVVRWVREKNKGVIGNLLLIAWLALALSTLTTKQHFVFDAMAGALLGELAWRTRARLSPEAERGHESPAGGSPA